MGLTPYPLFFSLELNSHCPLVLCIVPQTKPPRKELAASHPLASNRPALEYLKLMHDEWLHSNRLFGTAANHELLRLVMIGWMERKPFDLSDLAEASGLSRQQTMRRVEDLQELGWATSERHRNRVLVHPTTKLIELTERVMPSRMEYRASRWRKLLAMMEREPFKS